MVTEQLFEKKGTRLDEEHCWQAVVERDSRFDGEFVFAVQSTGIYCRPSCPSRRPKRERVSFFREPGEAENAGFRACLRCRPRGPEIAEHHTEIVQSACRLIEESPEAPSLEALGEQLGVSPYHLHRTFKRVMGITPRQYAAAHRSGRLKRELRNGESVTTAMYDAGYGSSSRLYEHATSLLGMTPAIYRRGGVGAKIRYAIADCSLGKLLVGATERGVCAVSLGESEKELQSGLRHEYPGAEVHRDDNGIGAWTEAILRHVDGKQPQLDLPIDVQATAFQQQVWEELRRIPYGTTKSYGEVARSIGKPNATRAVAQACGSNHVALVVPCHRVVRGDGELGGYRWGIDRKRALLERERAVAREDAYVAGQDK